MNWKKWGRVVKGDGSSTTIYHSDEGGLKIESRRRPIPHANRGGYWMYTSSYLIQPDGSEKEYHSLADAKEAAEELTDALDDDLKRLTGAPVNRS